MPTLAQLVRKYGTRVEGQVDGVAKEQAEQMKNDIVKGSPIDNTAGKGNLHGHFRDAWQGPDRVGHAHYRVKNLTVYGPVIEFGGYPGVGPKTEHVGGETLPADFQINAGIYPSQKPAAPMRRGLSKRALPLERALFQVLRES